MKTPREILLERHRAAEPKLDTIRRAVIGEGRRVAVPECRVADEATLPLLIWRELVLPSRRIWAGLAAIWILIFLFNFSQRDRAELIAGKRSLPSLEAIQAWKQQQRLLAELIGQNETHTARPPKAPLPQPRSEQHSETMAV